jgi:hypothetical protein
VPLLVLSLPILPSKSLSFISKLIVNLNVSFCTLIKNISSWVKGTLARTAYLVGLFLTFLDFSRLFATEKDA